MDDWPLYTHAFFQATLVVASGVTCFSSHALVVHLSWLSGRSLLCISAECVINTSGRDTLT